MIGWAGMRGAVSLAAALALPQSFPQRDLLVFLAFAVIVATLVGQGLTLPPLIRRLGLVTRDEQDMVLVAEARRRLTVIALSPDRRPRPAPTSSPTRWWTASASATSPSWPASTGGSRRWAPVATDGDRLAGAGASGPAVDRPVRGDCRPNASSAKLVIATERTELDQLVWPGGRSASGWPAGCGPHSTSTRPPCAPERSWAGGPIPDVLQGASGETPCRYKCC